MTRSLILSMLIFALCSCGRQRQEPKKVQPPPVPKAFHEEKSYEFISKRGRYKGDLVQSLYEEIMEKTPELKAIDLRIKNLQQSEDDSTYSFKNYESNNTDYYSSAHSHTSFIKDSALAKELTRLINQGEQEYAGLASIHRHHLKMIDSNKSSINDLYTFLKVKKTLPVIAGYQKANLTDPKKPTGFRARQEAVRRSLDSLIKK